MDNILAFIALTSAISILQVWENYRIYFGGDETINPDWSFMFIELFWFFVCVAVLIYGNLERYELLVPIAFILYNLYGWIAGYWSMKEAEVMERKIIFIPNFYLIFALVYCVLIFVLCVVVFFDSFGHRSEQSILSYIMGNKLAILWIVSAFIVIYIVTHKFKKYAKRTLNTQQQEAIQSNKQCSDIFGKIISISEISDVTSQLENDQYGIYVRGTKSNGFLIANIITLNSDKEFLCGGYITTDEGEIIELQSLALEA